MGRQAGWESQVGRQGQADWLGISGVCGQGQEGWLGISGVVSRQAGRHDFGHEY